MPFSAKNIYFDAKKTKKQKQIECGLALRLVSPRWKRVSLSIRVQTTPNGLLWFAKPNQTKPDQTKATNQSNQNETNQNGCLENLDLENSDPLKNDWDFKRSQF